MKKDTLQELAYISACFREWEGRMTAGYIPCFVKPEAQDRVGKATRNFTGLNGVPADYKVMGASGVTIGTGCDLGQQNAAGLRSMGVPEDLVSRFAPYLGKQGDDALLALHRTPLAVSDADCDTLDAAVHAHYVRRIARLYEGESAVAFCDIPRQAQAVTAHLFYHLGASKKYPNTWAALVRQDWAIAAAKLKNGALWAGPYDKGRASEGRLLEQLFGVAS